MQYTTERRLRARCIDAFVLEMKREDEEAAEALATGSEFKRKHTPAKLESTEYQAWLCARVEDHRKQGLLVTEQQFLDYEARRCLTEGDRARFIGDTRMEQTRNGRMYTRPSGQTGTIIESTRGSDGKRLVTFRPDFPHQAREPHGPEVYVQQFQVLEGTPGYNLLERVLGDEHV